MKQEARHSKASVLNAIDRALQLINHEATEKSGVDFSESGSLTVNWTGNEYEVQVAVLEDELGDNATKDTARLIALAVMTRLVRGFMQSKVGKSLVKVRASK